MYDFEYVSKKEYMLEKMKIVRLLQDVQRELNGKMNITTDGVFEITVTLPI